MVHIHRTASKLMNACTLNPSGQLSILSWCVSTQQYSSSSSNASLHLLIDRYRDSSVQARQDILRLQSNSIPITFLSAQYCFFLWHNMKEDGRYKKCRNGVTCIVLVCPVLPAHCLHLLFLGTAILTLLDNNIVCER